MTSVVGPFGIDPLYFALGLFASLICFVVFLLLPRGFRVHYCASHPKRYAWSARPRKLRRPGSAGTSMGGSVASGGRSTASSDMGFFGKRQQVGHGGAGSAYPSRRLTNPAGMGMGMEESIDFRGGGLVGGDNIHGHTHSHSHGGNLGTMQQSTAGASHNSDEAIIQNSMTQLRSQGVVIVAHGSRGKPKTVRLQLTDDSITWRTETRRKTSNGQNKEIKLGKLHSVALTNIMYVDVGKQTTALRRPENASVPEALCFSLLTKEGSLDLEANSPRERDALVGSFSLVLDNVHAQNWRDIYRASNEMPSSFDEYDEQV